MRIIKATIHTEVFSDDEELQTLINQGMDVLEGFDLGQLLAMTPGVIRGSGGDAMGMRLHMDHLVEQGDLVVDGDGWKADPDAIEVMQRLHVEMDDGITYFLNADLIPDLAEMAGKVV